MDIKGIGPDLSAFSKCRQQAYHIDAIVRDREDGVRFGFRGTPGGVLMRTERSQRLVKD